MKCMKALLAVCMLTVGCMYADDNKCGCNKPKPVVPRPAAVKEMPKPAPQKTAEAAPCEKPCEEPAKA